MITQKLHARVTRLVLNLQRFVDRYWYPPLIAVLAALDNFVVIVPTDGILISSSMLTPKRWVWLGLATAIGSTIGGVILAHFVEAHGLPWIQHMYPGVTETKTWALTDEFFLKYGLLLVFIVAATPLMQQPTVILAALADTPLGELGVVIFVGRTIKFLLIAYLGSHAPKVLARFWGMKGEMDEAGVKLP